MTSLKTILTPILAAMPLACIHAAGIEITSRPVSYENEKSLMMGALKAEAPLQSHFYHDEQVRALFPETQCMSVGGSTGGPKIREILQTMRDTNTLTGPLLLHYMFANDIWYCDRPLGMVKPNLWGLAYDYYGIVAVNQAKPIYRLLAVTAHETLHLMQKTRGIAELDPKADIYSLQARFLVNEAAAHALEVAYAFELAQAGDKRAWNGLQVPLKFPDGHEVPSPYLGLQSAFAAGYKKAVRKGNSHTASLRAGGRDAATAFVTTQEMLNIYNENVIQVYLSHIGTDQRGAGAPTWTNEKTELTGKLTETFNLTEGFRLPEPAARFGQNNEMRWAFEATELFRKRLGNSDDYLALRAQAKMDGNPYLDVDVKEVVAKMQGAAIGASPVHAVSIFNLLSGHTDTKSDTVPLDSDSDKRLNEIAAKAKEADDICPGGCGLIETLHRHAIKLALVTAQQLDKLDPGNGAMIVARRQGKYIYLNEAFDDAKLLEAVAHETRHIWQQNDLHALTSALDPRRVLLVSRFREADAFAYAVNFVYQYEKVSGQTVVKLPASPRDYGKLHPHNQMYAKYKMNMDCGMPQIYAYNYLIKDAFSNVRRVDYDGDNLSDMEKIVAKGASVFFKYPTSDTNLTHIFRQMGVMTFGKGPSVFDNWSDNDLLSLEKTGGIDPKNLSRLQKLESSRSSQSYSNWSVQILNTPAPQ